jgi:hypothetical protein
VSGKENLSEIHSCSGSAIEEDAATIVSRELTYLSTMTAFRGEVSKELYLSRNILPKTIANRVKEQKIHAGRFVTAVGIVVAELPSMTRPTTQ